MIAEQEAPVRHVYIGTLPNGDAISHECADASRCRLQEQIRQMEREREGKR